MISKKLFVECLNNIQKQEARVRAFEDALDDFTDNAPTFDCNNLYLKSLLDVLQEELNDKDDLITWWLWEYIEKKIKVVQSDGSEIWVDVFNPEDLYDYLVSENTTVEIPLR